MPHQAYILAHDLGTTGNKAMVIDAGTGMPAASVLVSYETVYPQANWAEQDAADWRRAVYRGTRQLPEQTDILLEPVFAQLADLSG